MSLSRLAAGRRLGARPRDVSEAGAWRFFAASSRQAENSEADTHVESHGEVLSDAGSPPAASRLRAPDTLARFVLASPVIRRSLSRRSGVAAKADLTRLGKPAIHAEAAQRQRRTLRLGKPIVRRSLSRRSGA